MRAAPPLRLRALTLRGALALLPLRSLRTQTLSSGALARTSPEPSSVETVQALHSANAPVLATLALPGPARMPRPRRTHLRRRPARSHLYSFAVGASGALALGASGALALGTSSPSLALALAARLASASGGFLRIFACPVVLSKEMRVFEPTTRSGFEDEPPAPDCEPPSDEARRDEAPGMEMGATLAAALPTPRLTDTRVLWASITVLVAVDVACSMVFCVLFLR